MFWKILLALASLADKVIDKFIPSRKEKGIDQYRKTSKDVLERQKTRQEKQREAYKEAKAILSVARNHDCDRDGC